jgi:hypothetical protein
LVIDPKVIANTQSPKKLAARKESVFVSTFDIRTHPCYYDNPFFNLSNNLHVHLKSHVKFIGHEHAFFPILLMQVYDYPSQKLGFIVLYFKVNLIFNGSVFKKKILWVIMCEDCCIASLANINATMCVYYLSALTVRGSLLGNKRSK